MDRRGFRGAPLRYYPAWRQLEQLEIGLEAFLTNRFHYPSRFDVPGLVGRSAAALKKAAVSARRTPSCWWPAM
jgi:hypothetical protein